MNRVARMLGKDEGEVIASASQHLFTAWHYRNQLAYSIRASDAASLEAERAHERLRLPAASSPVVFDELNYASAKGEMAKRHAAFCAYHVHDILMSVQGSMNKLNTVRRAGALLKELSGLRRKSPVAMLEEGVPSLRRFRDGIAHSGEFAVKSEKHASTCGYGNLVSGEGSVFIGGLTTGQKLVLTVDGKYLEFECSEETLRVVTDSIIASSEWVQPVWDFRGELGLEK